MHEVQNRVPAYFHQIHFRKVVQTVVITAALMAITRFAIEYAQKRTKNPITPFKDNQRATLAYLAASVAYLAASIAAIPLFTKQPGQGNRTISFQPFREEEAQEVATVPGRQVSTEEGLDAMRLSRERVCAVIQNINLHRIQQDVFLGGHQIISDFLHQTHYCSLESTSHQLLQPIKRQAIASLVDGLSAVGLTLKRDQDQINVVFSFDGYPQLKNFFRSCVPYGQNGASVKSSSIEGSVTLLIEGEVQSFYLSSSLAEKLFKIVMQASSKKQQFSSHNSRVHIQNDQSLLELTSRPLTSRSLFRNGKVTPILSIGSANYMHDHKQIASSQNSDTERDSIRSTSKEVLSERSIKESKEKVSKLKKEVVDFLCNHTHFMSTDRKNVSFMLDKELSIKLLSEFEILKKRNLSVHHSYSVSEVDGFDVIYVLDDAVGIDMNISPLDGEMERFFYERTIPFWMMLLSLYKTHVINGEPEDKIRKVRNQLEKNVINYISISKNSSSDSEKTFLLKKVRSLFEVTVEFEDLATRLIHEIPIAQENLASFLNKFTYQSSLRPVIIFGKENSSLKAQELFCKILSSISNRWMRFPLSDIVLYTYNGIPIINNNQNTDQIIKASANNIERFNGAFINNLLTESHDLLLNFELQLSSIHVRCEIENPSDKPNNIVLVRRNQKQHQEKFVGFQLGEIRKAYSKKARKARFKNVGKSLNSQFHLYYECLEMRRPSLFHTLKLKRNSKIET